ncbi:MAG: YaaR family protein [Christensenellales bacterium]
MKVADIRHVLPGTNERHAVAAKNAAADSGMAFSRHMTELNETQYHNYLNDLQERILKKGEKLKESADIKVLQEYRQLIGELLAQAAGNAYACIKSSIFDSRGRHKIFFVIRKINDKLDRLAQEILSEQKDNIKLLEMVDDIRGMLVDLFL